MTCDNLDSRLSLLIEGIVDAVCASETTHDTDISPVRSRSPLASPSRLSFASITSSSSTHTSQSDDEESSSSDDDGGDEEEEDDDDDDSDFEEPLRGILKQPQDHNDEDTSLPVDWAIAFERNVTWAIDVAVDIETGDHVPPSTLPHRQWVAKCRRDLMERANEAIKSGLLSVNEDFDVVSTVEGDDELAQLATAYSRYHKSLQDKQKLRVVGIKHKKTGALCKKGEERSRAQEMEMEQAEQESDDDDENDELDLDV
ncbi:hypothetical protein GGR57DRAFT_446960 [Xylariaceae sp. FL1272]|nr:hypothetical protein GGR57DRAFT_446960 [Xylariaceae sp. FL1272]